MPNHGKRARGGKKVQVTDEELMALLPFGKQGVAIPEIVAELEARNPRLDWGKLGAEYHIRHKLNALAKARRAEPIGAEGKWQTWVAKTATT